MRHDATITTPWVIVVGGFLGSGKTTLLLAAALHLSRRGLRSPRVLNDQGESLVDGEYAALHGLEHGEVTGGRFCCKFSSLVDVMDKSCKHSPDVIFAEPVGSCTDVSATTLRPLLEYNDSYRLAPFTVLVDLGRARELLRDDAAPSLTFSFETKFRKRIWSALQRRTSQLTIRQ
jgi:G3E family GTPase